MFHGIFNGAFHSVGLGRVQNACHLCFLSTKAARDERGTPTHGQTPVIHRASSMS